MKTPARVYLPEISVLTLVAAGSFLAFGLTFVVWMAIALHPLAGLGAGAVISALAYTAAESHAASQRTPSQAGAWSGNRFRDPEDDEQPERGPGAGAGYEPPSGWREP